jgi:hypothetical protein
MKPITHNGMVRTINHSVKFNDLTLTKSGLILKYKKKNKLEIPFAEVERIYIKKHKLNPLIELLCISAPFLLILMIIQYSPFDIVIIAALFTILPVFISVINYKWYRLYVRLKDGTFFSKRVPRHMKTESISILEKAQIEIFHYNINASV